MPVSDVTNQIVESLICPAPPTSHTELSSEMINDLIVPNPSKGEWEGARGREEGGSLREGGRREGEREEERKGNGGKGEEKGNEEREEGGREARGEIE